MTKSLISLLIAASSQVVMAQITESFTFALGATIPDNNPNGLSVSISPNSTITSLTDVDVTLTISGGFNGDLYLYLNHESGTSILLNRVGRSNGNSFGYGDSGFQVTLDDAAANGDIHVYRNVLNPNGGPITGSWSPDGRSISPMSVLDTSPRTQPLSVFNGASGSGIWTLFAADLSPIGESTISFFSLQLTGAVPEPADFAVVSGASLLLLGIYRRRTSRN